MSRAAEDAGRPRPTTDPAEIEKFNRLAADWWNPDGRMKPLHKFNPVRLGFIRDRLCTHFGIDAKIAKPFAGLRLLDIGCGGGLVCEPMARLGAEVVGADPARTNIEVARLHAEKSGLRIDYRAETAEALIAMGETFDVVLALEVVEHVPDVAQFISVCGNLLRPDGIMIIATINRTAKAFALAIVGAEYVLRCLPRGTHDYAKLVRPAELEEALKAAGLVVSFRTGVTFNPLTDAWRLGRDMDVNYMLTAEKPARATA